MNTTQRRDAAEAHEFASRRESAWQAAESFTADIEARAAELEVRGWSHDEAMQCARLEVMPTDLVAELEETRAA